MKTLLLSLYILNVALDLFLVGYYWKKNKTASGAFIVATLAWITAILTLVSND